MDYSILVVKVGSTLNSKITKYIDVTVTTGTDLYQGYYYAAVIIPSEIVGKVVALSVVASSSNRPAFVLLLFDAQARVYCTNASTQITVRLAYVD